MRQWLLFVIFFLCLHVAFAQNQWPKKIDVPNKGIITIYQPQPEALNGNKLTGRAAVSYTQKGSTDATFGAMWFEAIVNTDKTKRMVTIESVKVTKTKFSGVEDDPDKLKRFADLVESEVPKWNYTYSLDELLTSIKQEQAVTDPELKNDPPVVIYTTKPSLLISIDGEPKVQKDEKLNNMERVINTRFLIVKLDGKYYLYGSGLWYVSNSITSGYSYVKNLPSTIQKIDQQIEENTKKESDNPKEKPTTPSEIIVTTVPAELIQTEGEAEYKPIQGTSLLFATNSLDEIFKDINTQKTFILLSGRWYNADNLNGPWTYVPADKLPADFAKIPKGSEKDGVLANVAGTEEAADAKIEAQIPQTAKVEKDKVKCDVKFSGDPKFALIPNTSLQIAENADKTVMKAANGKYYALDNAIWFISDNPIGPYTVANERPADVEKIPPSSPAYNTKYVYVYDQTPQYVYVGYTPGYMGCYVYGPTVVYGTGYYYNPWYGPYYHPAPVTWGFGFHYNPWYGWGMSFGFSYNIGCFSFTMRIGGYPGGWYGPPYYRPPYHPWGYHGGYYGGRNNIVVNPHININRPININNINIGNGNNTRPSVNPKIDRNNNIYNRVGNGIQTNDVNRRPSAGARPSTGNVANTRPFAQPAINSKNNVMADRDGNVYKREGQNNWSQRDNKNNWSPVQQNNQSQISQLNKEMQNRDRGQTRQNNYNRPSTAMPSSRPAGGGMRGGGRRG